MKFSIKKNDIINVLSKVQGLTGRKTNLAITTNVLINATADRITLKATDLETGFEGSYPAHVEKEGELALNARKLYEIVKVFPEESIQINEIENNWIEIGNEKVEYHLVGMNPEEFPDIPSADEAQFISLEMAVLAKMIEKTVIIGGASDDKRAHITGIYIENIASEEPHTFRLVSTDGSRLSKVDHPFEMDPFLPPGKGVLIPKKGMQEVAKFLEAEGTVEIGIKDNNFVVKKEGLTIIIRLLEGDFPEYEGILKRGQPHEIFMDRQLFLMMLKRMSILSTEDYRSVIFKFDQDNLNITSTNPDIGESKEDMGITFSGDPIEVAFNPKFFIETLNVIDEDNIVLYIENSEKPCMLEGENDKQFITVIMPMRI